MTETVQGWYILKLYAQRRMHRGLGAPAPPKANNYTKITVAKYITIKILYKLTTSLIQPPSSPSYLRHCVCRNIQCINQPHRTRHRISPEHLEQGPRNRRHGCIKLLLAVPRIGVNLLLAARPSSPCLAALKNTGKRITRSGFSYTKFRVTADANGRNERQGIGLLLEMRALGRSLKRIL